MLAATLAAGFLIAQQVAGRSVRDALFLSTFGIATLPAVMMASSLVSVLAVIALSRVFRRAAPVRVAPAALGLATLLLAVWWALSVTAPRAAAIAVYLHMALFGATLVSAFWSVINERFDPYTAKKAVGRIGLGASLGGVAGGLLAWGASGFVPIAAMLVVMAALDLLCLACLLRLGPPSPVPAPPAEEHAPSALATLSRVPYLRDLALVVGLGAIGETLLDYVLKAEAASSFRKGPELMSFFALYNVGAGVLGLAAQSFLLPACLRILGLAGTVAMRPAAVLGGSLLGLVDPRLWTAVLARGSHDLLANSLFRSGYELLYTPIPEAEKRPTKAVVDVGFDKLGALLGGALVFVAVAVAPTWTIPVLFAAVAALCLANIALTGRLHRGYVGTLEQSLRAGKVRLDAGDILDEATLLTLARTGVALDRGTLLREIEALRTPTPSVGTLAPAIPRTAGSAPPSAGSTTAEDSLLQAVADLRSGKTERVRRALRRSPLETALTPHLIPLLARNEVFLDVLRSLRALAPFVTGQLTDALLDPAGDPVVRRRIPRVLKACTSQRAVDGLLLGLEDERFDMRAHCALALSAITRKKPDLRVPREAIFAIAVREAAQGSTEWKEGKDRGVEHVLTVLSLVLDREPLQISLWALRGEDPSLRGTALEYLQNVLPEDLRGALWPHLGDGARLATTARKRGREEVVDDLLRSRDSVSISRAVLRAKAMPE